MRGSIVCTVAVAVATSCTGVAQGQTLWRQPVSLGQTASTEYAGAMATGDNGRLLVAWPVADTGSLRGSVRFRLRPSATAPFTTVKQIVPPCPTAQCGTTAFKVAMNAAGQAIVVWRRRDTTTNTVTTSSATIAANGTPGPVQTVETHSTITDTVPLESFAIGIDTNGQAYLVASDPNQHPAGWTRATTGTWTGPTVLSPAAMSSFGTAIPVLAISGQHAAVAVKLADCGIVIGRRTPAGSWTTDTPDDEAGCDHTPGVTVGADGTVDAIWKTWRGNGFAVKTATAAAGASFGPPSVIGDGARSDGSRPAIRRLADGRVVAAWDDYSGKLINVRVNTAGTWGQVATMPGGANSTLDVHGVAVVDRITSVGRMPIGKPHSARLLSTTRRGIMPIAVSSTGEIAATLRDPFTRTLWLYQFTARPLPRLVLQTATPAVPITVTTRKRYVAGSLVQLEVTLNRRATDMAVPLRVQQLRSGRWVTIATRSPIAVGPFATVAVRLRTIGLTRLRVMVGKSTRVTNAVTVEMRRPRYRRIPVDASLAGRIVAGPSGIWVNELHALRELDPATGATLRTIAHTGVWSGLRPAGSSGLLVHDDRYDRLIRINTATGTRVSRRFFGGLWPASTDGQHLWVGGICPPSFPDVRTSCFDSTIGQQLDPLTLASTGVTATQPTFGLRQATVTGARVWFEGSDPNDGDHRIMVAANAATGAIDATSAIDAGRYDGQFFPLTDTTVWTAGYHGVKRAAPAPATTVPITPSHRFMDLARSATTVWMMQQRSLPRIGMYDGVLAQYRLDGTPTGKVVQLGETTSFAATLSIHNNVAWVFNVQESAVLRVPLP